MSASYTANGREVTTPCPWLTGVVTDHVAELVIREACAALGVLEVPVGSNRGPEADAWNALAGAPPGSYWCAAFAGAMWRKAGIALPPGYASCQNIMAWAQKTRRWTVHEPSLGAMVLYGDPGRAHHVGIIVRTTPAFISVEGNTTFSSQFSRNGIGVEMKQVVPGDYHVLGFAHLNPV
jgi:hypothetical protein